MNGYIYVIKNDINSKVYIGQTIRNLDIRFKEHCRNKCSKNELNMLIKKAILKYGKEHFHIELIEECSINSLNDKESYYISLFNSYKNGYNLTKGGSYGTKQLKLLYKQKEIVSLYKNNYSLRQISNLYNVDKFTIKHILEINNIPLRTIRTYKYTQEKRKEILNDLLTLSRKEIIDKWKISASYLSQLINGKRRI